MSEQAPRVSVGLPVYNGERYLSEALDSLRAQTFENFEIVIADNASTDATEQICSAYAANDPRIRYHRNALNLGVAANFRRVFELSSGEYFKWGAHDDRWAPEFLARCVEVLDQLPDVVVTHPRMNIMDENGRVLERYDVSLRTDVPSPHRRFYAAIRTTGRVLQIHGVMRARVLHNTPLIGDYTSSDVALIARLALHGLVVELPEYLLFYREHPQQLMRLDRHERASRFNRPDSAQIMLPEWRLYYELWLCVTQVPLPWSERAWCTLYLLCWPAWQRHWRRMAKDLARAALHLVGAPANFVRSR